MSDLVQRLRAIDRYDLDDQENTMMPIIKEAADRIEALESLQVSQGHGEPCYYCHQPCNSFAGNPDEWPVPLSHSDDPGVVKWHHVGCVTQRLQRIELLEARVAQQVKLFYAAGQDAARLHERIEVLEAALREVHGRKDCDYCLSNMEFARRALETK